MIDRCLAVLVLELGGDGEGDCQHQSAGFQSCLPIGLFADSAASADGLGCAHQQLQLLERRGHRLERFELEPHLCGVQRRLGELAPAIEFALPLRVALPD